MAKTKQEAQKTGQKTSEAKRPCSRSPVLETRSSSTNTVSCSRRLRGIDGSGPLDFKAFKRGVAKEVKTGISRKARDALTSLSKKRDKNDDFKLFGPKCLYEASKKQGFVKRLLGKKKKKGKLGEENHDNHPGFLAASLLVLLTSISILTYGIVKIQHLTTFKLTLVFVLFASGFILACCLFFHRKKTRNRQKIQPNETTPRSPLNSLRQKLRKKQLTGYSAEEQKILEELRKFALASLHKKTERQFNKLIFYICDELWLEDRGILTFKLMNIYLSQENSNTEKMILKEILCVALQEEAFLEKGILKKSAKSLSQKLQAKEQVEYSTADHEILKELHAFALVTLCDTKEKRFNVLISNIYQMLGLTEKEDRSSLTFQLNNIFINLNSEKIILEAIAAPMLYDCFGDSNQVYEYLDYLCATKLDKYEFGLCKPPYIKTSETSDSQFPSKMQLLREQALEAFCMLVKLNREGLPKLLSGIIKETKQKKTTTKAKVLRLLEEAHPSTVLLLFHLLENHLNFGAQQAESTLIKQIKKSAKYSKG